ncbi:MAG: flagellar motor switch protein FliN [Betaproteobacteria bacterium]
MSETGNETDFAEEEAVAEAKVGIDEEVITSIPITLNVEVGKTKLKLRDLLAVAQGTVLELDRSVGDLLDIKVNDAVIAKGEVVAISQNKLGVRILEIVSPMERARKLK